MAVSTTDAVSLEKSGRNRNARPSPALSSDRLTAQSSSSSRNSSGMSFLAIASMPLVTPSIKMPPINSSTPHCHSSDCTGLLISEAKAASVTSLSLLRMEPSMALAI